MGKMSVVGRMDTRQIVFLHQFIVAKGALGVQLLTCMGVGAKEAYESGSHN